MKLKEAFNNLPDAQGAVVVLSGGLDSTILMRLCVEKYGAMNVRALSFNYGQRQIIELVKATMSTSLLRVKHKVLDLSVLGDISMGFSANVDKGIAMPTIKDVLGDPTPKSYVPNRNMILMSLAASYAETQGMKYIVSGFQSIDEYGYWDTTATFVKSMNDVFNQNRKTQIKLVSPFVAITKSEELELLQELDGNIELTRYTLSCYNPNQEGESCGVCPTCSERIHNFAKFGVADLVPYSIQIPWHDLINGFQG